ncbi:uncharacterized protein LOC143908348 [Temnothorax americanus]|uniref:uncharacterized protein LOC143908348 n=1 Tax=Temnothorax americanus TaxID=1964332 RepID=UPI0040692898
MEPKERYNVRMLRGKMKGKFAKIKVVNARENNYAATIQRREKTCAIFIVNLCSSFGHRSVVVHFTTYINFIKICHIMIEVRASLRQWVAAIPGIVKLKPTHVICDKHFEDQHIICEWIKQDGSGRIIAQAPYKYPQLSKLAVPTKLLHDATNNEAVDPLGESSSHLVGSVINSVHCDKATPVKSPVPIEVSNHHTEKDSADVSSKSLNTPRQVNISSTSIIDTPHVQDMCYMAKANIMSIYIVI